MRLKIDSAKAEQLRSIVMYSENKYAKDIIDNINSLMDLGLKPETASHIPHPVRFSGKKNTFWIRKNTFSKK